MKTKTFEEFLRERCPSECQTNNSQDGEDRWLEQLDGSEYEEFGQEYGHYMFIMGGIDAYDKSIKIVKEINKDADAEYMQKVDADHNKITLYNHDQ